MKTPLFSCPSPTAGGGMPFSTNSATRYLQLAGQIAPYEFGYLPRTTEGNWRFAPDQAGAIDDLEVYVSANTRASATAFELMVNGVASGLTWNVGAGVTGWVGASGGPVNVAEGDLLSVRMVTGTGGGSLTIDAIQSSFTANSGDTVAHFVAAGDYGFNQSVSTSPQSIGMVGSSEGNTFASQWGAPSSYRTWGCRFQKPGTLTSFRVDISANTSTVPIDVEVYKNDVATGIKCTIPAATTGRFRGTGSVAIAVDDVLDVRRVATSSGSGSYRVGNMQACVVYDDEAYDVFGVTRPGRACRAITTPPISSRPISTSRGRRTPRPTRGSSSTRARSSGSGAG